MNAPAELSRMITSLEGRVSADEWQARVDLAACLPPGRAVRLGRPGLHAHLGARARAPSTSS